MNSVLAALREGRLLELPADGKESALQSLAGALAVHPAIPAGVEPFGEIAKRERESNTGIGMGVAVPHLAAKTDSGSLCCVVGWSPRGIDYGAEDKDDVHLVFMYYIPAGKMGAYLKEVSSLAQAVKQHGGVGLIERAPNLSAVRSQLEEWIQSAQGEEIHSSPAHLIKLGAKNTPPSMEATRG